MAHSVEDLARSPNPLAASYARFRVAERLLLTGHSHQAWPDVAMEGQLEAYYDAADHADDKWERALAKAELVRQGFARRIGGRAEEIALGSSTHELVLRFLSALPLPERPRLVTTDGEFHTLRRQLDRLGEEPGIELVKVPATPSDTIAMALAAETDERTAAVLVSSVLYGNAHIVPGLDHVVARARDVGAEVLVDAYHQVNVVPMSVEDDGLGDAFITGGGYKYCQLGEGNAFLRVPPGREHLRPVVTGWYSEFAALSYAPGEGFVEYGEGPWRWAGATYDPTSHYRASWVFDFQDQQGLTPEFLREVSRHQIELLAAEFDALDMDPRVLERDRSVPLARIGGFLALRAEDAAGIVERLRVSGTYADHRGDVLRLGPAPYLSDDQLRAAVAAVAEAAVPGGG